jgi:hypothetical protein
MNKLSKFSLADVLTVLTAIAFGFICFLGKNFYTLGNTTVSINWAIFITISLAGTALAAKQLKRTSGNFKTMFVAEIAVLVLFTVLMVMFTYSLFPHFFNVTAEKTEIQNKLQTSIVRAENMFAEYELYAENCKTNYKGRLDAAVYTKTREVSRVDYINYGFVEGDVSDDVQINNKMFTIHADLFPTTYSDTAANNGIKEVAISWLTKAKNTTSSWKPIGIVNVVNEIENNSKGWLSQLIRFSNDAAQGERRFSHFKYDLSFSDVKTHFTKLGSPTLFSIALAAVAYVLMLLSWFVTKRHPRGFGVLTTAPYEVVL